MRLPGKKIPNAPLPENIGKAQPEAPTIVLFVVTGCSGLIPNLPAAAAGPVSMKRLVKLLFATSQMIRMKCTGPKYYAVVAIRTSVTFLTMAHRLLLSGFV